jgi:two-component system phosphate regulon sensor histidine kinase PhoR
MGQGEWLRRLLEQKGLQRETNSVESMLRSARRMRAMIEDLVETARLESGGLELHKEVVDLTQLACDVAERVGTLRDRARISVEATEWVPPVLADPNRLERAIVNLLTNALKFSPPDSPVTVRLASAIGEAVLSVVDQGAGIPPEVLPHLFERFYQVSPTRRGEGLGLGLYITRLIVESHGGRVWVDSEHGKGSTFAFTLPLA